MAIAALSTTQPTMPGQEATAHATRRTHAERVDEFTVDVVVVVDKTRRPYAASGAVGLDAVAVMFVEDALSLVDPEGGDRIQPIPGVIARGGTGGLPDLEER